MVKQIINRWLLYSGVTGVILLWAGVGIGMHIAHLGFLDQRPISYLGVNKGTQLLFTCSLIASALLFISFGLFVKHKFKVKNRFFLYFLIGQAGQITAGLIPNTTGKWYKPVHTISAFILAFTLPLLIRQFARSQAKSKDYPLYVKLLRLEQVTFVIGIGLFIFVKGIAPLGEALPTVGFHVWMLVVTYKLSK